MKLPGLNRLGFGLSKKESAEKGAKISSKEVKAPRKRLQHKEFVYEIATKENIRGVRILGLNKSVQNLSIPSSIEGVPVRFIGRGAFESNSSLQTIEIPDSVTFIGARAFATCSSLEIVCLPVDLEVIQASTFENDAKLKQVILPYGLKRIASSAFQGCSNLEVLFHYMKRGISAKMTVDYSLKEDNLPSGLEYIGPHAFEGCASLREVYLPIAVKTIPSCAYKDCVSLERVLLHNAVRTVDECAFEGCDALRSVRMPASITSIGSNAFSKNTTLLYDSDKGFPTVESGEVWSSEHIPSHHLSYSSEMIPGSSKSFYSEDDLQKAIEMYELRSCTPRALRPAYADASSTTRFTLEDGIYVSKSSSKDSQVTIIMAGDLMCRPGQQRAASNEEQGTYDFSDCLSGISDILSSSDLAIGNMESMVSRSSALSDVKDFIDDRAYLNAPDEFLASVKAAGFDMVINAQNHAYDAGLTGVYETLDALNRNQLIHTGIFAHSKDKRYVLVRIHGITIGIVSYFDQARQKMKRANYTAEGLEAIFSNFNEYQIIEDIQSAKADGAEFIIAYCHWGREYTNEITKRQESFAQMVADAGADFLLGSHSHCLQPYSVILSSDGREVPVLYSAGNFLSNMSIYMPYNRDAILVKLKLERDNNGEVSIVSEGYCPCQIEENSAADGSVKVVSIAKEYQTASIERQVELDEAFIRIKQCVGDSPRFVCLEKSLLGGTLLEAEGLNGFDYERFIVSPPLVAHNRQVRRLENTPARFLFDTDSQTYKPTSQLGVHEAIVTFAGQIMADESLEKEAEGLGRYDFSRIFRGIEKCLKESDFAIGNLSSMAAVSYPSMSSFPHDSEIRASYCNTRTEYLTALKDAGFDALALSNPFNVCTGLDGIFETESAVKDAGLIPVGLGKEKGILVEIGGITIAFLSFVTECINRRNILTGDGGKLLLSEYVRSECKRQIDAAYESGADTVVVYVNCGSVAKKENLESRKRIAEEIAELGAGYVICSIPYVISRYYRYQTSDGRSVPIASSIGSLVSGRYSSGDFNSMLLRIHFRKTFSGEIEIADNVIPLKFFKATEASSNAIQPAQTYFNSAYKVSRFKKVKTDLKNKLGEDIALNSQRKIKVHSRNTNEFTIEEMYQILGAVPSEEDRSLLGERFAAQVSGFGGRRTDLMPGCVAFMGQHVGYQADSTRIREEDLIKNDVALVVDTKRHPEIPTIVVANVQEAFLKLAKAARDRFNPFTIAVTGSVGKTTTKDFLKEIFNSHYKTLCVEGNNNTLATIPLVLQKLSADDEVYIQEVHGGTINAAKRASKVIRPNVAVVTAISATHLSQMGSMDAVVQGKMDIAAGLDPDGILFLNDDAPELHAQNPSVRTCRYSASNPECDFFATDVHIGTDFSTFTIVSKGSEFDEPGAYEARLNIQGAHNVVNAVGAFAVARVAKIPPHKIIASLARYQTEGDRQNLIEVNGARFLVDVYSTSKLSLLTAVETLSNIPKGGEGRRIVAMGYLTDLGDISSRIHEETGRELARYDFDILVAYGQEALPLVRELRVAGKVAFCFDDLKTFNTMLKRLIRPHDIVLFKAGTRSHFKEDVIASLYGDVTA